MHPAHPLQVALLLAVSLSHSSALQCLNCVSTHTNMHSECQEGKYQGTGEKVNDRNTYEL